MSVYLGCKDCMRTYKACCPELLNHICVAPGKAEGL